MKTREAARLFCNKQGLGLSLVLVAILSSRQTVSKDILEILEEP